MNTSTITSSININKSKGIRRKEIERIRRVLSKYFSQIKQMLNQLLRKKVDRGKEIPSL